MRLRDREKSKPTMRVIDDENEEDVDDPADDSDCDPEWEEAAVNPELGGSGRKRKSFLPLQMQNNSKVQLLGDSSESDSERPSSSGESSKKKTSMTRPSTTTRLRSSVTSSLVKVPNDSNKRKVYTNVETKTMIVTDSKGATQTCKFKVLKREPDPTITKNPSTSKQPVLPPPAFSHGDFLKDITKKGDWIWQVDGMNLLQKFVPIKDPKTGLSLYKSSFTYDGLNALNSPKFQKISAVIVNKIKNETFVKVNEDLNPLEVKVKKEPVSEEVVSSSQGNNTVKGSEVDIAKTGKDKTDTTKVEPNNSISPIKIKQENLTSPALVDTPSIANYKNTFKDDFTVFLQALISQCLDSSFLRTCYNDKDEYFIEKIKTIDDVLEAKKFSLMSLPAFPNNDRILYAIHTYPVIEEKQLPAIKMENLNCVVCVEQGLEKLPACSSLCLELNGDPYERNTLLHVNLLVDIDDDLRVLRVCTNCSKILKLYSKMCHTKYLIFKQCERSVQKIMEKQENKMEASEVIISLLNNEPWCETKLLQVIRDWISVDDLKKET